MSEKPKAMATGKPAGEIWHVEDWAGAIVRKVKPATMTPPSRIYTGPQDRLIGGPHFDEIIAKGTPGQKELYTARAPLDLVKHNMASTGFPEERLSLVVGDVMQTLPEQAPRTSRCCASTPTSTPRPSTSWRRSIRGWSRAACC